MERTDAKSGFPKMRHYVGFWQIGSHFCVEVEIFSSLGISDEIFLTMDYF